MRLTPPAALLLLLAACSPAIPVCMQDAPKTEEETERIFEEIRNELGEDFLVDRVESVFFVATNNGRVSLEESRDTVSRVARFLKSDFFEKLPEKPIRIYLFRDKKTYEAYAEKAYARKPDTPFGFYMSHERKMVMNISTGQGTLAHELVHPLLAEDFPEVPSWFNEGFASLFEQSHHTREGKMRGLVNWRLPALQKALRSGEKVPLDRLIATSTNDFYGDDRGINYAAARYLCLYMQEKDLLKKFYAEFRKKKAEDPTGAASLKTVTGQAVDDLQKKWQEWVLTLKWH